MFYIFGFAQTFWEEHTSSQAHLLYWFVRLKTKRCSTANCRLIPSLPPNLKQHNTDAARLCTVGEIVPAARASSSVHDIIITALMLFGGKQIKYLQFVSETSFA